MFDDLPEIPHADRGLPGTLELDADRLTTGAESPFA